VKTPSITTLGHTIYIKQHMQLPSQYCSRFLAFIPYFFVKQEGVKNGNQTAAATAAAAAEKRERQRSEVALPATSPKPEQTTKQVK